ncbi:MAG: peptidylprolyl isomerase [Cocleimonas sp.]|nr:peptidylprolyl isomerase [Cocleimonas sp.]
MNNTTIATPPQSKKLPCFIYSLLVVYTLLFFPSISFAIEQPLDRIAAIVNNDIVMFSHVIKQAKRLKTVTQVSNNKRLFKQALEQLVLIKVQTQKGKELGIVVDDVMLNRSIEGIAKNNNLSLEAFKVALERQGVEYTIFRDEIRTRLIINGLKQRQSGQRLKISEQAVSDFIFSQAKQLNQNTEYQLQDILIPAPNGISLSHFNKKRKKAEKQRQKLLGQTLFESKRFPPKDLGWKSNNELPLAYVRTLSLMGVGEISPVVHNSQGFHILKLIATRGRTQQLQQQAHARHILIKDVSETGKQKAQALRQQLLKGVDFATLAKTHSADTGSALNGGDLGWTTPKTFVPPFAAVIKQAPLKAISEPVKTKFGWHIIQVLARKRVDTSKAAIRASAKAILSKKKNKDAYASWLQSLREDAFIEYRIKL